ncbi:hypothetical protein GA0070624_2631 [Micromonospora rhizosphaerae]|uniref:DUF4145 domain-containing protein n=2 Tax=Micromonospora rhizosphaerae TaxID=568872 RepID=A0A1C6S0R9_9ACTN|nr:hypothetical protein GA0070624_2631 [Micromonospora rhizosphaerae]
MEWDSLDEARTEVAASQSAELDKPKIDRGFDDLLPLTESHPTAAVMLAAQRVEAALAKALKANDIAPLRFAFVDMIRAAGRHGLIDNPTERVLHNLRVLRNEVAHSHEAELAGVTPARATDYVATAASMVDVLTSLAVRPTLPFPRQDAVDTEKGADSTN